LTEFVIGLILEYVNGLLSVFSFSELPFIGTILVLNVIGIKMKRTIFPLISIVIVGLMFVVTHFAMTLSPTGPEFVTLLILNHLVKLIVYLIGDLTMPITIIVIGFLKSRKN
jgi:hypothetical protein